MTKSKNQFGLAGVLIAVVGLLAACGGGSASASSLYSQANSALSTPQICTPSGSPSSAFGYGCGSLHVNQLVSGESDFQWAQQEDAVCWVSASGFVIHGGAIGSQGSKVASSVGGTFENPTGRCISVQSSAASGQAQHQTPTSTTRNNGVTLASFGGTGDEIDMQFPTDSPEFLWQPIVLVPGAEAALQTSDTQKGTAPPGKAWLEVIVSDGAGRCNPVSQSPCAGYMDLEGSVNNCPCISEGYTTYGPVTATINGQQYTLTEGGDGGAVTLSAPTETSTENFRKFYALVPKQSVMSFELHLAGTTESYGAYPPYVFPQWTSDVSMNLGAQYAP